VSLTKKKADIKKGRHGIPATVISEPIKAILLVLLTTTAFLSSIRASIVPSVLTPIPATPHSMGMLDMHTATKTSFIPLKYLTSNRLRALAGAPQAIPSILSISLLSALI